MKNNKASLVKQDESKVVLAPKLTKEMGNIPWKKSAKEILNLIRGANPWPGTYTYYEKEMLKVHEASLISETFKGNPGRVHEVSPQGIMVETPQGLLSLTEIQKPNKKKLKAQEFIKGYHLKPGSHFSEHP